MPANKNDICDALPTVIPNKSGFNTKTKQIELTSEDSETLKQALPEDWNKNLMSVVMCEDIKVDWKKKRQLLEHKLQDKK